MSDIYIQPGAGGSGSGTVTQINQGTGITLTPNPITTTGAVANAGATSVSNIDGTLTISPTTGAVVASIPSSVSLAGSPTTTTQSAGDSSTKISTTAFVTTAVNNAVAGVNPAVAVQAATAAVLPNSPTYASVAAGIGDTLTSGTNSVLVVDGYTPFLNDRILVKNQASAYQNGVYTVTQLGVGGVLPWIMTRALDYDQPSDVNNTGAIPVVNGTVNAATSWLLTSQITSIGPSGSSFTYTQFTLNPANVLTSTGTGLIIGLPFFMQTGANITIQLDAYAAFGYTINAVNGIATSSGTITAAVQIGGTNVTGLSAISVTSTPQNVSASALNTVVATNQVTLVLTSNSSATNLCFTMKMTRS